MRNKLNKDIYFVAVKLFVEDNKNNLLILKDKFGEWDLPGGRLRENDFNTNLEDIIERKVSEELGTNFEYNLICPVVYFRHERNEILDSNTKEKRRIFAIGYKAEYTCGDINLGQSHKKYEWVDRDNFKPEDYFAGGWLKGVKEYLDNYNDNIDDPKLGIYEHFKGGRYEVLGIVKHSETLEEMVLYKHLDADGGQWVRPKKMFMETIEIDGKEIPRFKLIRKK